VAVLGAQIALSRTELNVVRRERLSPRSLPQPTLTEGGEKALRRYAAPEERRSEENVDVTFGSTGRPQKR
jgi:hypothetical protein